MTTTQRTHLRRYERRSLSRDGAQIRQSAHRDDRAPHPVKSCVLAPIYETLTRLLTVGSSPSSGLICSMTWPGVAGRSGSGRWLGGSWSGRSANSGPACVAGGCAGGVSWDDLPADGGGAAQGHVGAVAAGGQTHANQHRDGRAGAGGIERRGRVAQSVVGVGLGSDGLGWVEGAVAGGRHRGERGPAGSSLGRRSRVSVSAAMPSAVLAHWPLSRVTTGTGRDASRGALPLLASRNWGFPLAGPDGRWR